MKPDRYAAGQEFCPAFYIKSYAPRNCSTEK
jgi:hypothetical protein